MTPPDYLPNDWFKRVWLRTHSWGKNYNMVITGDSGEGKSWTGVLWGEILDPSFNIGKVCFTPKEFLAATDNVKRSGEVIIMDETGISLSSRKWASLTNQLLNHTIQTFRYQHIITIFITPDFSYIDSQARRLINCFSEVSRNESAPPEMRIYDLSNDKKRGKQYFIHPLIKESPDTPYMVKLNKFIIKRKPSPELIKAYELKHKEYKARLRKDNLRMAELFEREMRETKDSIPEMVQSIIDNADRYKNARGKIDRDIIALKLKLSYNAAGTVKKLADKELQNMTE